ncbi:MAG: UDP-N-acetylmuramate--L-alanine ligase [Ruminococcus sp.]|nr:UDP-N-acetylmuramate--L-alanine ligase [Ruminococcus sp.]
MIGIGGSGMYPLAQILHAKGFFITGSDNNETDTLRAVRDMGIKVFLGQRAENIEGADLIIHTAAIMSDNPELKAAKASGVPVLERSDLLGIVTSWYEKAVCVSGTHGKTTVTSMITQILKDGGKDITAYIGGKLPVIGGSGCVGSSEVMICEACEFEDHFLKLSPNIAVVLNIDADHLDYFGTLENIIASFERFCGMARTVIANGDDPNAMKAVKSSSAEVITYGGAGCDWYPENISKKSGMLTEFDIYHRGDFFTHVRLNIPGAHNILNAVAAAAAASMAGASAEEISRGLDAFRGAKRRFEKYGEAGGITVCDDYGHHPAELEATLKAAAEMGFNKVWAVFQPFTFSRTALLLDDFAKALSIADRCVITAIMGSREKNTYNIFDRDLGRKTDGAVWFEDVQDHDENFELCAEYAAENAEKGDLIITMGCGDVNKCSWLILKKLEEKYGREAM